jgi:rubredoxin
VIPISLTTAILVYSFALAAIFLVLYLYTERGARRSQRILTQQFLWRCTYCGYTYLDEEAISVSQCPRCGSLNDEAEGRPRELRGHGAWAEAPDAVEAAVESRRNPSRRKRPTQKRRGPRRH